MAKFYEYCLPPGVHTMRLRYFDRPFYHKNEAQIFQVYHVRVNSSPFLASLVLSSLFFLCCVCLLYHAVFLKLRQFLIMLK